MAGVLSSKKGSYRSTDQLKVLNGSSNETDNGFQLQAIVQTPSETPWREAVL